ncbi:hypothetical protein [Corynebacterium jeikeium]|uniref:hypothetical protein n=1 Tax=Corynebacterium jeikeium TaxID=38289 RepID=UPI00054F59DA|nr:hypothetical protein [Corynebacterium jeikeium]
MSVYPDDSKPVPKGAYTPSSVKALQSVTEDSARAEIRSQALLPWREGRTNFFTNIIGGIGKAFQEGLRGIAGSLSSIFNPVKEAGVEVRDYQTTLNDRVELLDGVRGYASAYQTLNVYTDSGYVFSGYKWRFLPFGGQLGPSRGARVDPDGGLVLEETGLWTVYATVTKDDTSGLGALSNDQVDVHLFVSRDKWTKNDSPPADTLLRELRTTDMTIIGGKQTATVVFSVVVDRPNVFVGVRASAISNTRFLGGTLYSNLFAIKHDNRAIEPGQKTVPNE